MTIGEIMTEVEAIEALADRGDSESAHAHEDALLWAVLGAIAAGAPNAAELATAALATTKIKFSRWFA